MDCYGVEQGGKMGCLWFKLEFSIDNGNYRPTKVSPKFIKELEIAQYLIPFCDFPLDLLLIFLIVEQFSYFDIFINF